MPPPEFVSELADVARSDLALRLPHIHVQSRMELVWRHLGLRRRSQRRVAGKVSPAAAELHASPGTSPGTAGRGGSARGRFGGLVRLAGALHQRGAGGPSCAAPSFTPGKIADISTPYC